MTIINVGRRQERSGPTYQFKDTLGMMPEKMASKLYMQAYHFHHDYKVIEDEAMGWGFSFSRVINDIGRTINRAFRDTNNFIAKAAKDIAKVAEPIVVVVKDVGTFTEDVYDAAKKTALAALPPSLRTFVGTAITQLEDRVTNPAATVVAITQTAGEVAGNIVRETGNATEVVYREVAKPAFKIARNVANETIWQPIHKVVDVAILPILPKSLRDKVEKVMDIPDGAFRGKLTDKDVLAGVKAYAQIAMIPTAMAGKFSNDVINRLKKDAILGPFLEKVDMYSGGLLSSAQNLAATPDDIYNDRNIDWKARLIDALKIYLATVSVTALVRSTAVTAVGTETGLNTTPIGRAALAVGVAYGSAYAGGSLTNLTVKIGTDAAKDAAINEAKAATIKEAVKKGWVDDAYTARMILSAGGKFYAASGTDQTLMQTMDKVHDGEFQSLVNHEIQQRTGLPITYAHMVDVYNTDWATLADDLNRQMARMIPTMGTSDGEFLSQMGQNFVDEMRRIPSNFSNIGSNVLDELQRTPQNMARLASAVAKEADRTPENIAIIATNIARESAVAAENTARAAAQAAQDAAAEAARAPANIVTASQNVATTVVQAGSDIAAEAARTPSNIIDAASNISITPPSISPPKIDLSSIDDLIKKYGPDMLAYLQASYGQNFADMTFTPSQLSDIELNFKQPKKSKAPLLVGIFAILAAGYVATQD
jgi:hypothetical protein